MSLSQKFTRNIRVPMLLLVIGALTSFLFYSFLETVRREREELRLQHTAQEAVTAIYNSVNIFTYGLAGANGVFAASKTVEHDEFRDYVASRNIPAEFPGAHGFGFVQYVKREDLARFVEETRSDNQPDFRVRTSGAASELFVIKFIEPEQDNEVVRGFDIGTEKNRREAAEKAMLSGQPALSRHVQLFQDTQQQAGFLYLKPVYKKSLPRSTPEERKAAIEGWVFTPITLSKILQPTIQKFGNLISISVYEERNSSQEALLYGPKSSENLSYLPTQVATVTVGQQSWTVEIAPLPAFFTQDFTRVLPVSLAIIVLLISALLSFGALSYLNARERTYTNRLKEGEEFIRGILESANFSIIVTEANGIIRVFNQAASKMLGYSADEIIGKLTPEVLHVPEEVVAYSVILSQKLGRYIAPGFEVFTAAANNMCDATEWTYIRKDGSKFPVSLSLSAMRNEAGEIVAYMGIGEDISERKAAQRELQVSEERFKNSFTHASHGIALVGLDGKWLKVNKALCELLGRNEEDLLNLTFQEITHPKDLEKDLIFLKQALQGEIENYDMEKRYFHSSGEIVWVLLSVSLVRDTASQPLYFIAQIQNITARKYAEIELENKARELLSANQRAIEATDAKGQFLANMSHEIRTPLTGIIGYSESLLVDSLTNDEQRFALETVMRNGQHLLGIINDILDLSKIEAGKLDFEILPVNLSELVSDVANLMQHKANEKGLSLGFNYVFPVPRLIKTDSIRLKQILINLIGNAVKFTSIGGVKINIVFNPNEETISFQVIDTGPGLSEDQLERLFKSFSQADASTTRNFGGTGLGLVISQELAHKLGGDISVSSAIGKGSDFTVTIATGKVDQQDLISSIETRVTKSPVQPENKTVQLSGKVLVAEDGEDNQRLISFLLNKTGINYNMVQNGAMAIEEANKGGYDLILMDAQMPVMDGYTAIKKMREQGLKIPIIALTANAMKADVEKAFAVGCSDFLGKPFTRAQLFNKLGLFLQGPQETVIVEGSATIEPGNETLELVKDDPKMLGLVISVIGKLPLRLSSILEAADKSDWEETSRLAHSLRGVAGSLGLYEISKTAGTIESEANKKNEAKVVSGIDSLRLKIKDTEKFAEELKAKFC